MIDNVDTIKRLSIDLRGKGEVMKWTIDRITGNYTSDGYEIIQFLGTWTVIHENLYVNISIDSCSHARLLAEQHCIDSFHNALWASM